MLDVGGGNGVIGQVIHEMLDADVTSIDVEERFLPALTIKTAVYDGLHLPFSDASFDAITLFNMLHHVPNDLRYSSNAAVYAPVRSISKITYGSRA